MNRMGQKLNLTVEGVKNSETMELILQDKSKLVNTLAGVQFDDSLSDIDKNLYAAIRFPRDLRTLSMRISGTESWMTSLIFPQIQYAGPRETYSKYTASPCKPIFYRNFILFLKFLF